jgi:predicted nucleic acid-binding protein
MLLLASMATVDVDATLVIRAVEISIRWQTSYWDGLILAAAERAECKTVFSEDLADGQTYGSVTVVNSFIEPSREGSTG